MQGIRGDGHAAGACVGDVFCRCAHTAPAGSEVRWRGMDFCSEECLGRHIRRVATPRDYVDYAMGEDYAGLMRFLAENSEVLGDLAGCALPWDEVWAGVCEGYAEGCEEFVWWMEGRW